VAGSVDGPIERVILVHRLREVVALLALRVLEAAGPDINGELELDVERAPLQSIHPGYRRSRISGRYFPLFNNDAIAAWLARPAVQAGHVN